MRGSASGGIPPLPRSSITDLTGRIPAGRPVWEPAAQQVITGADGGQRIVVEIQRDETLLQVHWAAIEAFGKWPAPSAFVGGPNTTPQWPGFGRTRRDPLFVLVHVQHLSGIEAVTAASDATIEA